jgi:transposase
MEVVLKTDGLGRVRTPLQRRQSLLEEFERSGLSGAKFAALAGIKYSTFANWLQKRRRQSGEGSKGAKNSAEQMRWLETVLEQAQSPVGQDGSRLLLQLPGGARVEISTSGEAALAAVLLRALDKPAGAC